VVFVNFFFFFVFVCCAILFVFLPPKTGNTEFRPTFLADRKKVGRNSVSPPENFKLKNLKKKQNKRKGRNTAKVLHT